MTSFYSEIELSQLGFKSYGKNVLISRKASFYSIEKITLGSHVRIDDFCILSGDITIGSYVHISAFCALYGRYGIVIGNYSGLSPRCTVFSASDDFSGEFLINPTIPEQFTHVTGGLVRISDYVQIGTNSVIMPALTIDQGAVIGAFSFVVNNIDAWKIAYGLPAKPVKDRSKNFLQYIDQLPVNNN